MEQRLCTGPTGGSGGEEAFAEKAPEFNAEAGMRLGTLRRQHGSLHLQGDRRTPSLALLPSYSVGLI